MTWPGFGTRCASPGMSARPSGPAARKRFEEAYSTDAMVEAYLSLFRRLTAGGPP